MLVLHQREVVRTLPMRECIDLMRETFTALAEGRAVLPVRRYVGLGGGRGSLGMMPADLPVRSVAGIKVITVFPGNRGSDYDSHQGAVLLFEMRHGSLLATVDATAITAIRTAAVSGLATELLARPDADDLAIIGSGTEATTHLEAMLLVRPIRRVRVYSPTPTRARAFAKRAAGRRGMRIEISRTVEDAVRDATIICTTTSAATPIVSGPWIAAGAHINAVGSSVATDRELDTSAIARATLFVDCRESAANEAGDFLIPKAEGAITESHIAADLGDVVVGRHAGRTSTREVTVFKSVGLAVEDVAAASHVYDRARELGLGTTVDFGGHRHASLSTDGATSARARRAR